VFRFHRRAGLTGTAYGRPRWLGRLAAVLLVGLVATAGTAAPALAAQPSFTPEERAAAIVRPSVVYVGIEWEGWVRDQRDGQLWDPEPLTDLIEPIQLAYRCTGFVVSEDGFIVTAGHCVDPGVEGVALAFYEAIVQGYLDAGLLDASGVDSALTELAENSEIEGRAADDPATRNVFVQHGVAVSGINVGEAFPARVVDLSPVSAGDVALIKVDESPLPAVELAAGEVPVGTEVLAIGYPGSADDISDSTLEPSSKDGTISNLRTDGGVPVYETSAAMTGGMSGGPVVDLDGRVIGLASRIPAAEPQAFNFATASSLIAEMLAGNGVTNQLGQTDVQYRQGLDAYFAGRYSDAIESFDAVVARIPSHQQAQEYRQRAVEQRDTSGDVGQDDGGIPGWAIVAGIVVLGLLVVGGAVLALLLVARGRRRKAAPPAGPAGAVAPTTPLPFAPAPPAWAPPASAPPAWAPPASASAPPVSTSAPPAPPVSTSAPPAPPVSTSAPPAGGAIQGPPPAPNGPPPAPGMAPPSGPAMAAPAPEGPAVATASGAGYCGNCGAALGPEGRFCTHCGAPTT
jgi:S1-C subfamily serine protease